MSYQRTVYQGIIDSGLSHIFIFSKIFFYGKIGIMKKVKVLAVDSWLAIKALLLFIGFVATFVILIILLNEATNDYEYLYLLFPFGFLGIIYLSAKLGLKINYDVKTIKLCDDNIVISQREESTTLKWNELEEVSVKGIETSVSGGYGCMAIILTPIFNFLTFILLKPFYINIALSYTKDNELIKIQFPLVKWRTKQIEDKWINEKIDN